MNIYRKRVFKICNLFIVLIFCFNVISIAQNWQSLNANNHRLYQAHFIFDDTINNKLFVGYSYNIQSGSSFNSIAQWNGLYWDSLGSGINGIPYGICGFNGDIIVGGSFSSAGNALNAKNIAAWNGNSWYSLGDGLNGVVSSFIIDNNKLIAFGQFDSSAYLHTCKIAVWDNNQWNAFDTTKWIGSGIYSAQIFNGELYICGNFRNSNNTIINIAKWNGITWQSVGNGLMNNSWWISEMAVYKNELYIGGYFNKQMGTPGNYIVKWDGAGFTELLSGIDNGQVFSLHIFEDKLYVGGQFTSVSGIEANFIAYWDGSQWCSFGGDINGGIGVINSYNNSLYIGGGFNQINGDTSLSFIVKWIGGNHVDTCINLNNEINENRRQNQLQILLNPASDKIYISFNELNAKNTTVSVYDLLGKQVFSKHTTKNQMTVDISGLSNGLYLITVLSEDKFFHSRKIIVKH